jgi:hypothetical protein
MGFSVDSPAVLEINDEDTDVRPLWLTLGLFKRAISFTPQQLKIKFGLRSWHEEPNRDRHSS